MGFIEGMSLDQWFTWVHVGAGSAALFFGLIAMVAHKGGGSHRRWGTGYLWAMIIIFISSLGLLFFRPNFFLFAISILSFYTAITGRRGLARKTMHRGWSRPWLDGSMAWMAFTAGAAFIVWSLLSILGQYVSLSVPQMPSGFGILGSLFGLLLVSLSVADLKSFRQPPREKRWWWYYHMDRFLSSYIAAVTAFMVQVAGSTLPGEVQWVAWVAPGILGSLGINIWMGRYRRKFEGVRARRAQVGLSESAEQV